VRAYCVQCVAVRCSRTGRGANGGGEWFRCVCRRRLRPRWWGGGGELGADIRTARASEWERVCVCVRVWESHRASERAGGRRWARVTIIMGIWGWTGCEWWCRRPMRRRVSRVRRRRRCRRAIRVRQLASRRHRRTRLHPFIYIFQKPPATTTPLHAVPHPVTFRRR